MANHIMRLRGVSKSFGDPKSPVRAVQRVDLDLVRGETHGLIGESGSGKSTLGRLALGLLSPDSGSIEFDGEVISGFTPRQLRQMRQNLTVVFQEPFESLNPRMRIGHIVGEPLLIHRKQLSREDRERLVGETLELVELDSAMVDRYPNELSGGQQQRVGIARAIVTRPNMVVLDEPTSSLDVSVRARVIDLLQSLQAELGLTYLFVSHDISTVGYVSHQISVMLRGSVIESAPSAEMLANPRHPYSIALMSASLSTAPSTRHERVRLRVADANPLSEVGCQLADRCPFVLEECRTTVVPLVAVSEYHSVACLRHEEVNRLEFGKSGARVGRPLETEGNLGDV